MTENEIFFNKQFGSRAGHSTEHELSEVVDQIYDNFYKKIFWGMFLIQHIIDIKKNPDKYRINREKLLLAK